MGRRNAGGGRYFEGPEGPADVGEVPEDGDADCVGGDDAKGYFLGVVDGEVAAEERCYPEVFLKGRHLRGINGCAWERKGCVVEVCETMGVVRWF